MNYTKVKLIQKIKFSKNKLMNNFSKTTNSNYLTRKILQLNLILLSLINFIIQNKISAYNLRIHQIGLIGTDHLQ